MRSLAIVVFSRALVAPVLAEAQASNSRRGLAGVAPLLAERAGLLRPKHLNSIEG
jgi:hypothetical protein